jgi:uncharacterized protein YggE
MSGTMKVLRVLDSSGDSVIKFDETAAQAEARAKAKELFDRLTGKGARAFDVSEGDGKAKPIKSFAEVGTETVIVPILTGG